MKEVLTKKFWQDVTKTFHEAMEDSPPAETAPTESSPQDDSPPIADSNKQQP